MLFPFLWAYAATNGTFVPWTSLFRLNGGSGKGAIAPLVAGQTVVRIEKMKGSTVSKDYSALKNELAGDLSAAATSVSLMNKGGTKKVRLVSSDLKGLIPDGATLEIEAVQFTKLAMGDVICISTGRETSVRRFVKLKMTKEDTYLLTAYDGFGKKEALPKGALVGRVVNVTAGGKTFHPLKNENALSGFWGRLTEYGTHKAFGLFG